MEQTVKIEVNINQLNIILAGLAKLPLETSLETFTIVRQQADAQVQQNRPEGSLASKVIN